MRPNTRRLIKPLHKVDGKPMIAHVVDKLKAVGIERVVVNAFHLGDQVNDYFKGRTDIIVSREDKMLDANGKPFDKPLDTGGGIVKVLHYFEGKPFFAINADLPWIDGPVPSLLRMQQAWDSAKMDALLLLMPTEKARGFDTTRGDFAMEADGRVWRKNLQPPRPYVFVAAQILDPGLFANPPGEAFSNNHVWNLAESNNRLYGIRHEGTCYHISTVKDWKEAKELLKSGKGWGV